MKLIAALSSTMSLPPLTSTSMPLVPATGAAISITSLPPPAKMRSVAISVGSAAVCRSQSASLVTNTVSVPLRPS